MAAGLPSRRSNVSINAIRVRVPFSRSTARCDCKRFFSTSMQPANSSSPIGASCSFAARGQFSPPLRLLKHDKPHGFAIRLVITGESQGGALRAGGSMTNWETIIAMYVENGMMVHLGGMEGLQPSRDPSSLTTDMRNSLNCLHYGRQRMVR
jgi:hypothetical protein